MDANRADEIINSHGVINVLYNGYPIWIEQVMGKTAMVQDLANQRRFEVDVHDLVEG